MAPADAANGDFVRYLPWMFVAFGVFFTALSAWIIQREMRGRHWRAVEGRVVDHHGRASRNYDTGGTTILYAAEIEYRLPGLPPARFVDGTASSNPPPVGSIVQLRYNPDDHDQMMVWAPLRRAAFYGIFLAMGLIFIACGIFAMLIT